MTIIQIIIEEVEEVVVVVVVGVVVAPLHLPEGGHRGRDAAHLRMLAASVKL